MNIDADLKKILKLTLGRKYREKLGNLLLQETGKAIERSDEEAAPGQPRYLEDERWFQAAVVRLRNRVPVITQEQAIDILGEILIEKGLAYTVPLGRPS